MSIISQLLILYLLLGQNAFDSKLSKFWTLEFT